MDASTKEVVNVISIIFGSITLISPILLGIALKSHPPKKINSIYGFRTGISSKNQETWDYSQKLAANTMITFSAASIPVYVALLWISPSFLDNTSIWGQASMSRLYLGLALVIIVIIFSVVTVQIKAKMVWKKSTME